MAFLRAPLLALLAASAAATSEDASALVQAQVHRHGRSEAEGQPARPGAKMSQVSAAVESFGRELWQAVSRLSPQGAAAAPGAEVGGIFIQRWNTATEGSHVEFNLNSSCETSDEFGPNNCTLHWGENASMDLHLHLANGFQKGDNVAISFNLSLEALNKSDLISNFITGTPIGVGLSCDVCEGSITSTFTFGALLTEFTKPSPLMGEELCGTGEDSLAQLTDVNMSDVPLHMSAGPPEAWQLSGHLLGSIDITRNGSVTLSHSTKQSIIPGPPALAQMRERSPKPLAPGSFLDAIDHTLRQTIPAVLKEGQKPKTVAEYKLLTGARVPAKLNALVMKLKVGDVEAGGVADFRLGADRGCSASAEQGTQCTFLFNTASNATMGSHMAYTAEEGSYANVTITPKIGGLVGVMMSAVLKPTTMLIPLCGENVTQNVNGKESQISPGPCGFFSYKMSGPPFEAFLPDLGVLPTAVQGAPMVPKTLGEFPPTAVEMDVRLTHADGRTMVRLLHSVGLDYGY